MQFKKCPKCKATMMNINGNYRCSQCSYETKTLEEIEKLEEYNSANNTSRK